MILAQTQIPGLIKDTKTGMIENKNLAQYEMIKKERKQEKIITDLTRRLEKIEKFLGL